MKTTVTGVEMLRKLLDSGQAGDNIGALLRGTNREGVERGQVLAALNSIKRHAKLKAEAYVLTKEEGGRHTPFFTNPAAVLLSHDGRNRRGHATGGDGDAR